VFSTACRPKIAYFLKWPRPPRFSQTCISARKARIKTAVPSKEQKVVAARTQDRAARDHLALSLQRYKPVKWSLVGTANQAPCREVAATRIYFGRMRPDAAGWRNDRHIARLRRWCANFRSTPVGGQSTPSDLFSLLPSGSARGSVAAARWCFVASSIASAHNPSHFSRALAVPFEPVASLA
jgi:hypothetical protein